MENIEIALLSEGDVPESSATMISNEETVVGCWKYIEGYVVATDKRLMVLTVRNMKKGLYACASYPWRHAVEWSAEGVNGILGQARFRVVFKETTVEIKAGSSDTAWSLNSAAASCC